MENTLEYISEESRERAKEALAFYQSSPRKLWSAQRISNKGDDIRDFLPKGVDHIIHYGKEIISDLLIDE